MQYASQYEVVCLLERSKTKHTRSACNIILVCLPTALNTIDALRTLIQMLPLPTLPGTFFSSCSHRFYSPAQLVSFINKRFNTQRPSGQAVNRCLPFPPPGILPPFLSRTGFSKFHFSASCAHRFASNFADLRSRAFDLSM